MVHIHPLLCRLVAEFVGTYVLVLTVGCNVLSGRGQWGGVSIACSLMVMIYALANCSGANFNPAVSLALGITGYMPTDKRNPGDNMWAYVFMYMGTQLFGGLMAGLTYLVLFGSSFALAPTPGHTFMQAALAEIIYTFMLCFVVLNVACTHRNRNNGYFGLAIGFVIVAAAYSGGSVSMGCFNPAVAVGIDMASAPKSVGYCFGYALCELFGGAIAALAFCFVRPDDANMRGHRLVPKFFPNSHVSDESYPLPCKLVSEFLGTFMLVLTVGLNVLSGSTAAVFSIACSLMCMIYALGSVSGANFNPAVSVALMLRGKLKPVPDGVSYIGVQIFAGVCASFVYSFMMNGQTFQLKPASSTWAQALFGEFFFTFILAYVVLGVQANLSEYFGLAIGMCVTVGGLAIGGLSGGSLNPAVSFGISTSYIISHGDFYPCLIYSTVELAAGAAAAGLFRVTHAKEMDPPGPDLTFASPRNNFENILRQSETKSGKDHA